MSDLSGLPACSMHDRSMHDDITHFYHCCMMHAWMVSKDLMHVNHEMKGLLQGAGGHRVMKCLNPSLRPTTKSYKIIIYH